MLSARISVVNCLSCKRCLSGHPPPNSLGLHIRPTAKLTQVADRYKSEITITAKNENVSARSVMGLMALEVQPRQIITINAAGEDETAAVDDIARLLVYGLAEPHCPDFTQFIEGLAADQKKRLTL